MQISSARNYGGGEKHLIDLTRGLSERGHDVFVALRPTNDWQKRFDFLPDENFLHVSLRNSFGVLSAQKIAEFVNEKNIDIVHAHVARDYIPASLACRLSKNAKFILTRHVLFPMKPFYKFALSNLAKAVAVSSAVEKNLQSLFPKNKIALIANGIFIENQSDESKRRLGEEFRFLHDIPFDALIVGTIGELKILKGQRDFVLAAKIIYEKFPDARFVIVGEDHSFKKEFRQELKRLVKIFRLDKNFLFLDWVEDTAPLLAAMDVFVSPSHSESFGLAILEAMASGTAIVAAETDGANELLQNNFTGKLVPIDEPLKLAEAVAELLSDQKKRENLGANAQSSATRKFSLEKMIDETEKVYRNTLLTNQS